MNKQLFLLITLLSASAGIIAMDANQNAAEALLQEINKAATLLELQQADQRFIQLQSVLPPHMFHILTCSLNGRRSQLINPPVVPSVKPPSARQLFPDNNDSN
ncbi:MAG: hypothetical protein WCE21_00485 [Candidatus Babeliales bacterium]